MKNLVLTMFLIFSMLLAHSGRTDKYGGHNNRKTGGYHYHNAGYAHAAGNPYQDHTKCGTCSTSKSTKAPNRSTPSLFDSSVDQKEGTATVKILQTPDGNLIKINLLTGKTYIWSDEKMNWVKWDSAGVKEKNK